MHRRPRTSSTRGSTFSRFAVLASRVGKELTRVPDDQIEERTFSMAEYTAFVASIEMDVRKFRAKQASAVAAVEVR